MMAEYSAFSLLANALKLNGYDFRFRFGEGHHDAAQSALEIATALQRDRSSREVLDRLMVFGELNELLGLSSWQNAEEQAL